MIIKLTINPEQSPQIKHFTQDEIIIGSKEQDHVDLSLEFEELNPSSLKIVKKDQKYILQNLNNDPFVTLNGLPFGRKALQNFDLIQIGKTLIRFETEIPPLGLLENEEDLYETQEDPVLELSSTENIPAKEENSQTSPDPEKWITKIDEQLEKLTEKKEKNHSEQLDIDSLFSEVEKLDHKEIESQMAEIPTPMIPENSLKNYTLTEFDDECENWVQEKEIENCEEQSPEEIKKPFSWKVWIWMLLVTSSLCALLATYYYLTIYNQSYDEELSAAESIADIAMALKYAQINHIKPIQQNWSDPEFIKNNLVNVVTHNYPAFDNIDSRGKFINTPYLLRIYTSSDFSQFVVIAQPAPTMLQKFIPKNSIVVDSKAMELRKIQDLKGLNRLLVNPGTLEGSQAKEVTKIIQKGELIPLTFIARKKNDNEFSPPKALILVRPGSENLIYNAPRYYQLGENVMRKALHLLETPGSSHEVARLKQEMNMISKMPNMIFYSSLGIQFAQDAQKALASFVPSSKFLTAYITFNSRGAMVNSHLLMDEDLTILKKEKNISEPIAYNKELFKKGTDLDLDNPLFFKLNALFLKRQEMLQPIYNEIVSNLNQNFDNAETGNYSIHQLIQDYEILDQKIVLELGEAIEKLHEEYQNLSTQQFLSYLQKARLDQAVKRYEIYKKNHDKQNPLQENVETQLSKVKNSSNLSELNTVAEDTLQQLGCDKLDCSKTSILTENRFRTEMINKLNQLLFSPDSKNLTFKSDETSLLDKILEKIWINESHEKKFYLNEYEILKKSHLNSPKLQKIDSI